jgi:hypothetical protein
MRSFVWMSRYYTAMVPGLIIYPIRCSQDILEHHFRNLRGSCGDNKNPSVSECQQGARNGTVVRLYRDKKSNSGAAPIDLAAVMYKRPDEARKKRARISEKPPAAAPGIQTRDDDDDNNDDPFPMDFSLFELESVEDDIATSVHS